MTNQEIFDKVAVHLLTQNARSERGGECKYRGHNGMMCAAGCLIPDDQYHTDMEGTAWGYLYGCGGEVLEASCFYEDCESTADNLILEFQNIHDNASVLSWKFKLEKLAKKFKLSAEAIKGF